ncbi:hypothetical protein ACMHYB_60445 [Sorangium sp. So ce1128]
MRSKLWLHVAAFAVMVIAACSVHDSVVVPGAAGGGSPGGGAAPASTDAEATPAGLRAAYIAAVQRQAPPAYVAEPGRRGAWTARNEAHGFAAELDAQGVSVAPEGGAWRLGLSVAGYGCGERLRPVSRVEPEGAGNRIAYRRVDPGSGAAVEEWYVNGPLGLEQGFSIDAPPCAGAGGIAIELALDGLTASPRGEGEADLRDGEGRAALRYTDVYARDAEGRALPARLSAEGKLLSIHVDAAGAVYPVEIDPLIWAQQAKLTASDGAAEDLFGSSVAVSGDGSTAVVGAPGDNVGSNPGQGSAYVFVRSGTTWTEQAKLTASDGAASDLFGSSVAVSGDGSTAVVGASLDDVGGNPNQGSAYVFVRSGTTWTEQAKLTASDGAAEDLFGSSVAVSGDGSTAVVGARLDDVGGNENQGSAYVFVRSGTTWTEQAKLTASDGAAGDRLGVSVAVSGDGSTAVVGAFLDDVGGNPLQGSAYVFVRSGTTWTGQAKLTASDGAAFDQLGVSVAVSGDGSTAVVGAPGDDVAGNENQGSAYVFVRSGTTWTEQAKLTASDGAAFDNSGRSVAVSGDGSTAVVGAPGDEVAGNPNQGSAYVFVRSGTTWTEQAKLTASDGAAGDDFGVSVAVSGDGSTAVVGASLDDVGGNSDQGSAYVFVLAKGNGDACAAADECASSFCVDGVCCNSACGGGATDCQACSVAAGAAVNGTCGPLTGNACNDGDACTTNDTCSAGACVGVPPNCDDSNVCTNDSCNPSTGCVHTNVSNGTQCNDGSACTTNDTCQSGTCVGTNLPNGTACSDNNACTIDDSCQSGVCVPKKVKTCPHGRTCKPATGSCSG